MPSARCYPTLTTQCVSAMRLTTAFKVLRSVLLFASAAPFGMSAAQGDESHSRREDRLMALARLDAAVRYFHPIVATRPTAWDSSFAAHALQVANASSANAYARAVDEMLAGLADPATARVGRLRSGWAAEWRADSVLLIHATPSGAGDSVLFEKARAARAVVFDLRDGGAELPGSMLARALLSRRATAPMQRSLKYFGFPRSSNGPQGNYRITWRAIPGEVFDGGAPRDAPVAFLVDARTVLPPLALAMRTHGRGVLVGVRTTTVAVSGETHRVAMGEGVSVDVRLAERSGAALGVLVDTTIADDTSALSVAARLAYRPVHIEPSTPVDTLTPITLPPTSAGEWRARYPSVGYRILAAARLWGTIHLFYPYKSLIHGSWDAAYLSSLPAIETAHDDMAFAKAIARFASQIGDSHVFVNSAALLREMFSRPPVLARFVEDRLLVTRPLDSAASAVGLRVGDEITAIDGEPIKRRIARLSATLASSTPQGLRARLESELLMGPDGSIAMLAVRTANGRAVTIAVPRLRPEFRDLSKPQKPPPTDSIFYLLPGNIGYVDLVRLTPPMVDRMFNALAATEAIVFDMRGYPQGTAWVIAPRLDTATGPTVGAQFRYLLVPSPDTTHTTVVVSADLLPRSPRAAKYTGRTVMLIDERTMSQAEHTGLYLEAANHTTFIGSPSNGANGTVTGFSLPGQIIVTFTGMDVRHADGRQLQRVGLLPAVAVAPTAAGIRAGRDEVLEAAVTYLKKSGGPPRNLPE